ncbi:hypothetical protein KIL84_001238 [Mauremys mutica]|uniref:Uncharacterized protein n=1 Tax=Mauremys mutica TaxID=74926 RepID=A0A9D3X0F5_9SAUR|nr:hypothetical protein KIL84_001238 [Mauremys mutica]
MQDWDCNHCNIMTQHEATHSRRFEGKGGGISLFWIEFITLILATLTWPGINDSYHSDISDEAIHVWSFKCTTGHHGEYIVNTPYQGKIQPYKGRISLHAPAPRKLLSLNTGHCNMVIWGQRGHNLGAHKFFIWCCF